MKKIIALLLALATLFSLTAVACAEEDGPPPEHALTYACIRDKEDVVLEVHDDYVIFGMYPQTMVTDDDLIVTLNAKTGEMPTANDSKDWTAQDFANTDNYKGDYPNFMFFMDVEVDGEYYRAVYFTEYRLWRPHEHNGSVSNRSYQKDNGLQCNEVYWYKYEPISWVVLEDVNNKKFLFSEIALDTVPFDRSSNSGGKDYSTSTGRKFINNDFLYYAFTKTEREKIADTEITINVASNYKIKDKVFMLSKDELTNAKYGFNTDENASDDMRLKMLTDYAVSQGAVTYPEGSEEAGALDGASGYTTLATRTRVGGNTHVYYFRPPYGVRDNFYGCITQGFCPGLNLICE